MVEARAHQSLHIILLDWAKAFDKISVLALPTILRRFAVPEPFVLAITEDTGGSLFKVSAGGGASSERAQRGGIRQGCTLSPFLFVVVLSALMSDAEDLLRSRRDLILTPVVPFFDIENADDTAVVARSAPLAEDALAAILEVAAPFGLTINRSKTKLLSMGSDLF
eukprot:12859324-Alexandrium_andersonii.AAC.1